MKNLSNVKIGIVGLGYVALPLAVEIGKEYECIGLDINAHRIKELKQWINRFLECILAVAHNQFKEMGASSIRALDKENIVLFDIKCLLS